MLVHLVLNLRKQKNIDTICFVKFLHPGHAFSKKVDVCKVTSRHRLLDSGSE